MKKKQTMVVVTFHIPKLWLDEIDELVRKRYFPNRAEFIRMAIRDALMEWWEREAD